MKKTALFALIGLVAGGVVAGILLNPLTPEPLTPQPAPTAKEIAAPAALRWQVGAAQVYEYRNTLNVQTNASPGAAQDNWTGLAIDIHGLFNLRVFKVTADEIFVGVQLAPLTVQFSGVTIPAYEALLRRFFIVVLTADGQIVRFHYPRTVAASSQPLLAELVAAVQAVIRATPLQHWGSRESHSTGDYQADYQRDGAQIRKHKRAYHRVTLQDMRDADTLNATVKHSAFTLAPAAHGSWLAFFEGSERVTVNSVAGKLAEFEQEIALRLTAQSIDPLLAISQAAADVEQVLAVFAAEQGEIQDVLAEMQRDALRKGLAGKSYEDLAAGLTLAVLHQLSAGEIQGHFDQLKQYLRAYPEAARQIPDTLRQENLPLEASAMLIGALHGANTPQAQHVLADMISGSEVVPSPYMAQAMTTATLITAPLPELEAALWQRIEQGEAGIADLALEVVGGVGRNLALHGDSDRADAILQRLSGYLQTPHALPPQRVLSALGNSGAQDLLPIVAPYLQAEDAELRQAAYRSLRHSEDTASRQSLEQAMRAEAEPGARATAVATLVERPDRQQALAAVQAQLGVESEAAIRLDMVKLLGAHKHTDPAIVETLQRQLEAEEYRDMKKEVLRALYAEE